MLDGNRLPDETVGGGWFSVVALPSLVQQICRATAYKSTRYPKETEDIKEEYIPFV